MARSRAAKPRPATKQAKPIARRPALEVRRELALEAAIIDAPLDPLPRLVYGDWLQAVGDQRGEWVSLSAGVEADPKNTQLRAAAVAFLDDHRTELLGEGAALLPGAWIGWRGGFIDELRLQPFHNQRIVLRQFEALLAHPSCRFVRHVALGQVPRLQEIFRALATAAPPLLDSLVLLDHEHSAATLELEPLLELPSLRRLALTTGRTLPLPHLVELHLVLTRDQGWLATGMPALEELTLDCRHYQPAAARLAEIVEQLPALRRLRVLHGHDADGQLAALLPHVHRLEVLDLSHSDLSDLGAARLLATPARFQLLALRTAISEPMAAELRERLRDVAVSNPAGPSIYDLRDDEPGTSWISHRVVTEGRDSLRLVPGAGRCLYSLGTHHSIADRETKALPLLDASVTMPCSDFDTWAWANAAIAHGRLFHYDEAELIAREGLLRAPREPNFFAIVLHALRCSGRLDGAVKILPRAYTALAHADASRHSKGVVGACLSGCLITLAQAARHDELLELAEEHAAILDPNMHAVIAMAHVARSELAEARASFKLAGDKARVVGIVAEPRRRAVFDHASAVMNLAGRKPSRPDALVALARAKVAGYFDWHWIAFDPNLAALRGEAGFEALLARPISR